MALGLFKTSGFFLLLLFVLCEARPMSLQESTHPTVVEARARKLGPGSCTAFDISVSQGEASGVGVPTWAVQILNTCINPKCSISNIIVQCGQFHSASFVNPNVFRRLDSQGTCIVNNGNVLSNGEVLAFQYQEEFEEPLRLKSANVYCA